MRRVGEGGGVDGSNYFCSREGDNNVVVVSVVLDSKRMTLSLRLISRVVVSLERVQLDRVYLNLLFQ